ncbi:MAG TPA: rhodanese-like domain-containing protein [Thermoanaerobaculia bacterium]|nr:rhodanese-like domain-containing protein [Thermoanaerobaculia bacterium]
MNQLDISAAELAGRLADGGDDLVVIDVREPYEWSAGHLGEARHIPLQQVPARVDEIPREAEVIMVCRSGARSARAQQYLLAHGFRRVRNLVGGLMAWKRDVDPAMRVP